MHEILHAIEHAFFDTLALLPWLVIVYIVMELLENKTDLSRSKRLQGKGAPLIGSVTGLIPQCGFSVMAAKLYEKKYITIGTLAAIFLSTSDEAFILLLSDGAGAVWLLPFIVSKITIGLTVGYALDFVVKKFGGQTLRIQPDYELSAPKTVHEIFMKNYLDELAQDNECTACGKPHDGTRPVYTYLAVPVLHALKVAGAVFLINFLLGYLIELVGENAFYAFMQRNIYLQPFITALIGLIPNCASSVVVTQSFLIGGISFGSCLAGLCANAGLGFVVLIKNTAKWKRNLAFIAFLYLVSVAFGLLFNLFGII